MLRSFRVANHKSFRDEAELLLMPAYDKSRPVVPVAAVFGANASGKSNLIDALRWMRTAVRESYARWEPGAGVPRTPFRLDPAVTVCPSLYCVEIIVGESRYTYGVEVDDQRVVSEWLHAYPHNRARVIFERDGEQIRLGSTVPDYRARREQLARQTRDNALLLSVAAHNDLDAVLPVYHWFRTGVRFADGAATAGDELLRRLGDEMQRSAIVELVGAADLGISDIIPRHHAELAAQGRDEDETLAAIREWLKHDRMDAEVAKMAARVAEVGDRGARLREAPRLSFHHGKSRVPLSLEDQSDGTKSWVGLVSVALDVIGGAGLMIVDEVDASLHPHLAGRLINLFRDPETNPDSAQLLFTTHDATLLDEETLSRDEIWFVEKEPDSGASRLYPLTDFHPRKNENTEGRYLAGNYGAIPVVSDRQFRQAVRDSGTRDAAA